jgi:DNA-binding MarR family transcriptional regulator
MKKKHIADIRAFNRFYTSIIGLLDQHILNSRYSLPEVRILYELYHHDDLTASDILSSLHIDKGYLSRILRQFEKQNLISKKRSGEDRRATHLSLTYTGRTEFEILNDASNKQIRKMLEVLKDKECDKLVRSMSEVKTILSKTHQHNF